MPCKHDVLLSNNQWTCNRTLQLPKEELEKIFGGYLDEPYHKCDITMWCYEEREADA